MVRIYPNLQKDDKASGANFRLSSVSATLSELRDEVKALRESEEQIRKSALDASLKPASPLAYFLSLYLPADWEPHSRDLVLL